MRRVFGFAVAAVLVFGALATGCGSAPPPAPETPKVEAPKAPVAEEPTAPQQATLDPDVVEKCLATANAKRAKFSGEPAKVTLKHVLIKHKGAKNPVDGVARTREEACVRAMEARDKVVAGADFDSVVKEYSDEPGADTRNGSIGSVERASLQKPFADAAFELGINQMSDIVETESGFHLIFRTE